MRLICPNCGAQYAVDARVIPEAGRDVQCSNCGNTWFQTHPEKAAEPSAEPEATPRAETRRASDAFTRREPRPEPEITPPAQPDPEPEIAPELPPDPELQWRPPEPAPAEATGTAAPEPVEAPAAPPVAGQEPARDIAPPATEVPDDPPREVSAFHRPAAAETAPPDDVFENAADESDMPEEFEEAERPPVERPRRPVDDSVLAVLKEEAAREAAARKAESGGLETQGELNMEMPERAFSPPPPFGRDPARVLPSDTQSPEAPPRPERVAPRRELLPDIEEINSTLKPEDRPAAEPVESAAAREERNRGRRFGMSLAFFLSGFLVLLYAQAPRVADAVPQAAPALENYVATVNSGRLWLDRTLRDAVDAVQGAEG